ncbi:MAG: HupE/UreJ family protein [Haliscomenobacter sp.]|uniref:HupE/UreJ family protein n=1 Tax=Haliscomenobacter sp. TaxID=2717303 RepID=UPI0029B3A84A|nr:HupE/UreJ family protein [Haliscomenobacter sp.]MDX2069771.1 HupE/UreJ family protein [Haliscomenobacter sp.]
MSLVPFLSLIVGAILFAHPQLKAHPMPNSLLQLSVGVKQVHVQVQIPLNELTAAWGLNEDLDPAQFMQQYQPRLRAYLQAHIQAKTLKGDAWTIQIEDFKLGKTENPINGLYYELQGTATMLPPKGEDLHHFMLHYDAVIHQVVTHTILVSAFSKWRNEKNRQQVGTIHLDIPTGKILPLEVRLDEENNWAEFSKMFFLGVEHIAAGTDHLLFLLALLLPAPLLSAGRRWSKYGGFRYSLGRLFKLTLAFTIGHSLTLLIGTMRWISVPAQPIELLIAISILVSALHAVKPVFGGKEWWIALDFGLIHGMAFAETLSNLRLDLPQLLLSLFGFNLGIEAMQIGVIVLCLPALILISQCAVNGKFRNVFAATVSIAALAWLLERISGEPNLLTKAIAQGINYAPFCLLALTIVAFFLYWAEHKSFSFKFQNLKS